MRKSEKPKDYGAELRAQRFATRWESCDGERQLHRKFVMPASPRSTSSPTAKPQEEAKGNRNWPF